MAVSGTIDQEARELARTYQYDRYLSALLLARRNRAQLATLAAFAGELQRIPFIVSEPMMARVRLQWWRDALVAGVQAGRHTGAEGSGHPLADAVLMTAKECALPIGLLQGMIDAAETELEPDLFADTLAVDQIMNKFDGALFELAGRVLVSQTSRDVWTSAAHAFGYARLAAEVNWRIKVGAQTYGSRDIAQGESLQRVFIARAEQGLAEVCDRYPTLDRPAQGALLPLAVVRPMLKACAMASKQSGGTPVYVSQFTRARALLWAHWRRQI